MLRNRQVSKVFQFKSLNYAFQNGSRMQRCITIMTWFFVVNFLSSQIKIISIKPMISVQCVPNSVKYKMEHMFYGVYYLVYVHVFGSSTFNFIYATSLILFVLSLLLASTPCIFLLYLLIIIAAFMQSNLLFK